MRTSYHTRPGPEGFGHSAILADVRKSGIKPANLAPDVGVNVCFDVEAQHFDRVICVAAEFGHSNQSVRSNGIYEPLDETPRSSDNMTDLTQCAMYEQSIARIDAGGISRSPRIMIVTYYLLAVVTIESRTTRQRNEFTVTVEVGLAAGPDRLSSRLFRPREGRPVDNGIVAIV